MRSAFLILTLLAPMALGDTIVLDDGTELSGDVLWEADGRMALRLDDGTTRFVEVDRVVRIVADADVLATFERRRAAAGRAPAAGRAEALLDLAVWAGERPLLLERAEQLLEEAVGLDPDLADLTDYHLVRLALETERFDEAADRARRALARNPNHERIEALAASGQEAVVVHLTDRLAPVLEAYRKRRYHMVLALGRDLVDSLDADESQALAEEFETRSGLALSSILIDSRFQQTCQAPRCEGGMVQCPYCEGTGRKKRFRRQVKNDSGDVVNEAVYSVWCGHCDGRIHMPCDRCGGTGLDLGKPTEFERPDLVKTLLRLVEENRGRFETMVEGVRSRQSDDRVRVVDAYAILTMARQAIFFLEQAMEFEPTLGSPAGANLTVQLRQMHEVMQTFLSGLSTTYMEQADRLYQEAMDLEVNQDTLRVANVPSRVLKLQESLSLAEESRKYIVQLIESDPSSRSFLKGNYQRRLELIDEFIDRNRKALIAMRKVEAAPERFGRILESLGGTSGPGEFEASGTSGNGGSSGSGTSR